MHKLNKEYRGIDRTTDVLSFALNDNKHINAIINSLGDIFISIPKMKEQAKEYANNVYKKLENYVITNNIGEQDKNDTSLPINLIPASSDNAIYPNLDSWYYIKNKQVFAYIAIDTKDQTYGWCYNGGIDNYKEGEC